MNQPTTPNTVEDFLPLPEKGDNGYRASSLDGGIRHQSYSAAQMRAYVLADRAQRPVTGSPVAKENAVQQAQQWAQEAKTQRATVLSILRYFGLPENDWEALSLIRAKMAAEAAQPEQPASPTVAGSVDTPESKVHAKVECFGFNTEDVRLVLTDRDKTQEVRMHNDDAWFIVEAIAAANRARLAPTAQGLPAQAVPEGDPVKMANWEQMYGHVVTDAINGDEIRLPIRFADDLLDALSTAMHVHQPAAHASANTPEGK